MMRMAPNGKNLMCRSCLERKPAQKGISQAKTAEPKHQKVEGLMKEYFCKSCKYSFKRAKHLVISTCPYCDSGSLMVKGSVARIMADVAKMKGE